MNFKGVLSIFYIFMLLLTTSSTLAANEKIFSSKEVVGFMPSISPNGRWLSFPTISANSSAMQIIDLKNNTKRTIEQQIMIQGGVSWADDSEALYFSVSQVNNKQQIEDVILKYIIASGKTVRVTNNSYLGTLLFAEVSKKGKILFIEYLSKYEIINENKYYYANLWLISESSGEVRKLADGLVGQFCSWINDDTVCYLRGKITGSKISWAAYQIGIANSKERLLSNDVAGFNTIKDKLIIYKKKGQSFDIESLSLNDFKNTLIGNIMDIYSPSISPDGTTLTFMRDNQVWTVNLLNLEEHQLTKGTEIKKYPIWTKDGRYIIYSTINDLIRIDYNRD